MKNQAKEGLNIFMDKERTTETKKAPIPKPPNKEPTVLVQKEIKYVDNNIERPPPSAVSMEDAVIGALLIDKKAADEVMQLLSAEVFYDSRNRLVFKALFELYEKNIPIDILTVSEELKRTGNTIKAGGDYHLIELSQKVSSAAHIEVHCRIILQKYILRELISNSRNVMFQALHNDPDVFDLIDSIEANIARISSVAIKQSKHEDKLNPEEELKAKLLAVRKGDTPGIYTGVSEFDEWCGGFQKRELITIASRPGMGKTTVALSVASTAAIDKGIPVAIFSLEMSAIDLKYRIAARLAQIDYAKIRTAKLTDEEYEKVVAALKFLETVKLQVLDTSFHKNRLENIIKKMRELVALGYKEIFIDYVQLIKLMRATSDRTADLSTITRELKATANELNVPIIIFAQLNRGVDQRPGHMPGLSDLKQSGSIEEDSDTVIFLLRPAYYQQKENVGVELPRQVIGETQFIVAKGRNIGVRTFRTYLDFFKYTFQSYSDVDF
jgi:replicative DNA helicase